MNTKEKFLGLIRELLTAGGALAFGAYDGLTSIIGLIVSLFAIGWAWRHHEGEQVLATSIRKALSLVPGVLLAIKWVDPHTAGLIASFLAPLFAIIWSFRDKSSDTNFPNITKSSGLAPLIILSLSMAFLFASCGSNLLDVAADKSKVKYETETHTVYSADAFTPLVNADRANELIRQGIDRANASLRDATK